MTTGSPEQRPQRHLRLVPAAAGGRRGDPDGAQAPASGSPAGRIVVLWIRGELDAAAADVVAVALSRAFARRARHVVVDLSGLTHSAVRGLALLTVAWHLATEIGITYRVSGASPQVRAAWTLLWPQGRPPDLPTAHSAVRDVLAGSPATGPALPGWGEPGARAGLALVRTHTGPDGRLC